MNFESSMRTDEYLSADGRSARRLLDSDGRPDTEINDSAHACLARLASCVHANAPGLEPEQLERAVRWLKRWKLAKQPESVRDWHEFSSIVEKNRELPEQRALQVKAYRLSWLSRLYCLGAGVLGAMAVTSCIGGAGAIWCVGLVLCTLATVVLSERAFLRSTLVSKEQEQRNLWTSIRQAQSVGELNAAGLFAYLPGAMRTPGRPFDEQQWVLATRAEVVRLADALYNDPVEFLADRAD